MLLRVWYLWSCDISHVHGWHKTILCNLHSNLFIVLLLAWWQLLVAPETGHMKTVYTQELNYDWWSLFTLRNLASYIENRADWRLLQCSHKSPPLIPSWARWIQTAPSHPVFVGFILMLLTCLCQGLWTALFPSGCSTEMMCAFPCCICTFLQSPVTSILFDWILF